MINETKVTLKNGFINNVLRLQSKKILKNE